MMMEEEEERGNEIIIDIRKWIAKQKETLRRVLLADRQFLETSSLVNEVCFIVSNIKKTK